MVTRGLGVSVGLFDCFSMILALGNKVKYNRVISSLQVPISSLQEADFDWKSAIFSFFGFLRGFKD